MTLRHADFDSDVWIRFKEQAEARRESLRRQNDMDLTPEETSRLRGRIAELTYWLGLPAPEPPRE